MICPIETQENTELLLAYSAGKLDAGTTSVLERHLAVCPACREFVGNQRAVWAALQTWEAPPVSPDFDRRLHQRIEKEVSWWGRLIRPFRPMLVRQGLPVAVAACVVVIAATLLQQRPDAAEPFPPTESAQLEAIQPEQVEHALEDMQMLSDFSRQVRAAANESQM